MKKLLSSFSDADFRSEVDLFGSGRSQPWFYISSSWLCGGRAYRTQLFCYLKACGRDELNTMNLWGGMDAACPRSAKDQGSGPSFPTQQFAIHREEPFCPPINSGIQRRSRGVAKVQRMIGDRRWLLENAALAYF